MHSPLNPKNSILETLPSPPLACRRRFLPSFLPSFAPSSPGNILLTRNCELRISDFGLARELPKDSDASAEARHDGDGMTEVSHIAPREHEDRSKEGGWVEGKQTGERERDGSSAGVWRVLRGVASSPPDVFRVYLLPSVGNNQAWAN